MMMMDMCCDENPVFTLEHDKDPGTAVGAEVTVKAKLIRKTEAVEGDKESSFTCEYQVLSVDGAPAEDPEDAQDGEEPDDMEEISKLADEEMSKGKK